MSLLAHIKLPLLLFFLVTLGPSLFHTYLWTKQKEVAYKRTYLQSLFEHPSSNIWTLPQMFEGYIHTSEWSYVPFKHWRGVGSNIRALMYECQSVSDGGRCKFFWGCLRIGTFIRSHKKKWRSKSHHDSADRTHLDEAWNQECTHPPWDKTSQDFQRTCQWTSSSPPDQHQSTVNVVFSSSSQHHG